MLDVGVTDETNPLFDRNDVKEDRDRKFTRQYVQAQFRNKMSAKNRLLLDGKLMDKSGVEIVVPDVKNLEEWHKQSQQFGNALRGSRDGLKISEHLKPDMKRIYEYPTKSALTDVRSVAH